MNRPNGSSQAVETKAPAKVSDEARTPRERFDLEAAVFSAVVSGIVESELLPVAADGEDTGLAVSQQRIRAYRAARRFVDVADGVELKWKEGSEQPDPQERFDLEFAVLFETVSAIVLSDLLSDAEENGVYTATALQEQYTRFYQAARYFVDLVDGAAAN